MLRRGQGREQQFTTYDDKILSLRQFYDQNGHRTFLFSPLNPYGNGSGTLHSTLQNEMDIISSDGHLVCAVRLLELSAEFSSDQKALRERPMPRRASLSFAQHLKGFPSPSQ